MSRGCWLAGGMGVRRRERLEEEGELGERKVTGRASGICSYQWGIGLRALVMFWGLTEGRLVTTGELGCWLGKEGFGSGFSANRLC